MTETVASPIRTGPRWQRVALVLLGLYGVWTGLSIPAGAPSIVTTTIGLVLAGGIAISAPGNRRYKQVVLIALAAMLVLAVVSLAWA